LRDYFNHLRVIQENPWLERFEHEGRNMSGARCERLPAGTDPVTAGILQTLPPRFLQTEELCKTHRLPRP
jgi:hypothetical protein